MSRMQEEKPPSPLVFPPSYTTITPSESFDNPACGEVTWHTLISAPNTETSDLSVGIAICPPNIGQLCAHRHDQAEVYHILEGEGEITIDGFSTDVIAGSTIFIPRNAEHKIVNRGNERLRWFYVFAEDSFENVIYRFTGLNGQEGQT